MTLKEAKGNWTFAYIGENPDGWAKRMGQSVANTASYDMQNQRGNMVTANMGVMHFRKSSAPRSRTFFGSDH